jgi:hypothetical protein
VMMSLHAIEMVITRASYSSGISYADIATVDRHPEARKALYSGQLGESFDQFYKPQITGTQQYHIDSLEGALTDAIVEKAGDYVRDGTTAEDDTILWRTLYACVLIIAKTITEAGRSKGISETALMSYHFAEIRPYAEGTNAYVLTLEGP